MLDVLIQKYFEKNFTYDEICHLLNNKHKIKISLTTLQRKISQLGLKRKNVEESDLVNIVDAVIKELCSCGYDLGYKSLWQKLKKNYNLTVKRETVYRILKIADPEGVANRFGNRLKRRQYLSLGPNYAWHCDGYDKLKQFGFAIHGCVDGFSRFVVWLEVGTTNNDPNVTSFYYLKAVKKFQCVPTILRCDRGTENTFIGLLQTCLRAKHDDSLSAENSFVQGKSTKNQRIESFWGRLRKHSMDFYIQFFKCMLERNLFDGSSLHIKCLQYCFGPLIKYDLHQSKILWNDHRIRKQRILNNVCGKPYVMFHCAKKYGCLDYRKYVDINIIDRLIQKTTRISQLYDPDFGITVQRLLPEHEVPINADEALELYKQVLDAIQESGDINL